jgi:peptidoglycan/xylan/chitin deacetylase (PgdA/CDA1 family)
VEVQREDIVRSKVFLEEITGGAVTTFCYPFGAHSDETVDTVRDAGFFAACSIGGARVLRTSDPLRLPRVPVNNWDGQEFEARLSGWFKGY